MKIKIIIDYDGTLTAEEEQVEQLIELNLQTLSQEILLIPKGKLQKDYKVAQRKILAAPHRYHWQVNGLAACYSTEGAFILSTVTLQQMLKGNRLYWQRIKSHFKSGVVDPLTTCTDYLFHKNSAFLPPKFRKETKETLITLIKHPQIQPIVLTNSKTGKVKQHLETLGITAKGENKGNFPYEIEVLGEAHQYRLDPRWNHSFLHPLHGQIQTLPIGGKLKVDLRRPAYHRILLSLLEEKTKIVAVGDVFSLVGALPLMMGMYFVLLSAPYVPTWSRNFVQKHPRGRVIKNLSQLPEEVERILKED